MLAGFCEDPRAHMFCEDPRAHMWRLLSELQRHLAFVDFKAQALRPRHTVTRMRLMIRLV